MTRFRAHMFVRNVRGHLGLFEPQLQRGAFRMVLYYSDYREVICVSPAHLQLREPGTRGALL